MILSSEQQEIMESSKTGNNITIVAGAGCGKSSTLRIIAAANPTRNFLCLCFNKANQLESENHPNKPSNIFYTTSHSLAYRDVIDYAHRAKVQFLSTSDIPMSILEARKISDKLSIKEVTTLTTEIKTKVIPTLNLFLQSDSLSLQEFLEEALADEREKTLLIGTITLYWESILSTKKGSARMSHDVYLKLYQMQQRRIFTYAESSKAVPKEIHCIMLDEAQDTTPCVSSIFKNNDHLQQIVVGDPHQQIYSFRGAMNIMETLVGYEKKFLSNSFRFNRTIAKLANKVLEKKDSEFLLTGVSEKTSSKTITHLCRTNAKVLETILYEGQKLKKISFTDKIFTNINMKEVFSKLFHMQNAYFNSEIKYPCRELSHIKNKDTLFQALEEDADLASLYNLGSRVAQTYGSLWEANKFIKEICTEEANTTTISVSTIHKYKGLEADLVILKDDFLPKDEDGFARLELLEEEENLNLLYVAITRAKVSILLPDYIQNYLGI